MKEKGHEAQPSLHWYLIFQIIGSIILIFLTVFIFWLTFNIYVIAGDASWDANQQTLFSIFSFSLPMIIADFMSIHTLSVLKKRKKTNDFSSFKRKEFLFLFLPVWFIPLLYLWTIVLLYGILSLEITKIGMEFRRPHAEGIYETITLISYLTFLPLNILIIAPWFSYLGYWRRKQEAMLTSSKQ